MDEANEKTAVRQVRGTFCLPNRLQRCPRAPASDFRWGPFVCAAVDLLGSGCRGAKGGYGRERFCSMLKTASGGVLRVCLAALLSVIAMPVGAQQWPAKPITIVNGFPAGAGND